MPDSINFENLNLKNNLFTFLFDLSSISAYNQTGYVFSENSSEISEEEFLQTIQSLIASKTNGDVQLSDADIKKMFDSLDGNHDTILSGDELIQCESYINAMFGNFSDLPTTSDNTVISDNVATSANNPIETIFPQGVPEITEEKFMQSIQSLLAAKVGENSQLSEDKIKEIFDGLDLDHNGILTADELIKYNDTDTAQNNFTLEEFCQSFASLFPNETAEGLGDTLIPEETTLANEIADPAVNPFVDSGKVGSSGGGGGGGDYDTTVAPAKTAEEYRAEIATKEGEKQKVIQDTKTNIQAQEQLITDTLTKEGSGVPAEAMSEYATQNAALDTQISGTTTAIQAQEGIIQDSTAKSASCATAIGSVSQQISNLKAQAGVSKNDAAAQGRISGKIGNLEAKNRELEGAKQAAATALDKAQQEKGRLEQEKSNLQGQKAGLLDKILEEYEDSIAPGVKQVITDAKGEIQRLQAKETQDLSSLNSAIQTLKTELAQLEQKKDTDKIISENTESNFDTDGNRITPIKIPETEAEFAKYWFNSPSLIASFRKLKPIMQEQLINLCDYAKEHDIKITWTSLYRSRAAQEAIYAKEGPGGLAAKPGSSAHEFGLAADLRARYPDGKDARSALGRQWLRMGKQMAREKGMPDVFRWGGNFAPPRVELWHFDMKGLLKYS